MPDRPTKLAALCLAISPMMLVGCGSGAASSELVTAPGATGATTASGVTVTPTATAVSDDPSSSRTSPGLVDIARRAVTDLLSDPRGDEPSFLTDDPQTWWVEINLEVPIDPADYDDPLAALPPPFDALAPHAIELVVRANTPNDSTEVPFSRARLEPPFTGLEAQLDGSLQQATTVPGGTPPPTSTWPIDNVRIMSITVPVADFDALPEAADILGSVAPEDVTLGPAGGFDVLSLADAEAGVPATHPPLTGTVTWTSESDD
ncbi:MAG: hypothetical protein AAFO29_26675 [Actinomycetota bacterium]